MRTRASGWFPPDRPILDLTFSLSAITEMHDRLIVTTGLYLAAAGTPVSLLTRDPNITASGLVPIVW